MFFRRKEPNTLPAVKKVSELINTKSHNQKKYISLMLVPSYSTGKTRSLRISRAFLYTMAVILFIFCSVIFGLYLKSLHFQREARDLSNALDETQATFSEFQQEAEQVQNDLIDATTEMIEQLTEEQMRAQMEIYRQDRRHQDTMEDMWDIIDEIEERFRELDESRQEIVNNLGARAIIPPIASLISQMEESQEQLRAAHTVDYQPAAVSEPAIGLMSFSPQAAYTEDELMNRLYGLLNELEIQRLLLEDLEFYREEMSPYLLNYPTIWPVRGGISSGFGWRRNPFGGRGSEFHNGVDIMARSGTPIRAAGGGTVIFSGWQNGYGNTVIIDHGDGITTKYAHNTRNSAREGQSVSRGDIIAYVGSTGRSTGAHLHYEIRENGTAVDPLPFLLEHFTV